jgi:hypothetical protein
MSFDGIQVPFSDSICTVFLFIYVFVCVDVHSVHCFKFKNLHIDITPQVTQTAIYTILYSRSRRKSLEFIIKPRQYNKAYNPVDLVDCIIIKLIFYEC